MTTTFSGARARLWLYRTAGEIGLDGLEVEAENLLVAAFAAEDTDGEIGEREFRRIVEDALYWEAGDIDKAIAEVCCERA